MRYYNIFDDVDDMQMTYGDFGRDTYGLHLILDGRKVCFCIRDESENLGRNQHEDKKQFIEKLRTGWRPINF